jgi:hypothetical protein
METSWKLIPKKKKKKKKIVIRKCSEIIWLHFVQGKSCWMWLEFYTLFGNFHVKAEHFYLMIFGYFVNI